SLDSTSAAVTNPSFLNRLSIGYTVPSLITSPPNSRSCLTRSYPYNRRPRSAHNTHNSRVPLRICVVQLSKKPESMSPSILYDKVLVNGLFGGRHELLCVYDEPVFVRSPRRRGRHPLASNTSDAYNVAGPC